MAPKAEKKPAKKVAKSTSSAAAKKRKLAKAETYKIYIYKVLKQVCVPLRVSCKCLGLLAHKRQGIVRCFFPCPAQQLPSAPSPS